MCSSVGIIQNQPKREIEMQNLTNQELNLIREWFNALDDLKGLGYFQKKDYELGAKITALAGGRASHSVLFRGGLPIEKPKLVRDWVGGYVRFNRPIKNGYGVMPAGTVFKVEAAAVTAHFISEPCECCGFKFRFTAKGKGKFDGAEWLGYELAKACGNCDTELPEGCGGIFKNEKQCEGYFSE